ncbi:cytochrome P450 [Streptomyces sp. NPDC058274]|uniref:cytochrome P450 n=1 Tax=Streptomyces sp. NPDC058274 TaxID=3346416 RepID=UPI0036E15AF2
MTTVPALLDAGPDSVQEDIAEAYALVRAFDGDATCPAAGDPHAEFAELRRRGAVQRSTLERVMAGVDVPEETATLVWHVLSFADAEAVLRDEDTFSSSAYDESMGRLIGRSFLQMDHQEHRIWRNVLHGGFNRQAVLALRDAVRSDTAAALTAVAARGGGDLVAEVAFPVALTTIARMIGFPPGTRIGTLYTWAVGLLDDTGGRISTAVEELLDTPSAWVSGGLVDLLLGTENPEIGSGPELLPAVRLLLSTGTEPPFRSLATLMYATLTDGSVADLLRTDPSAASSVFQECWRWECPLTWVLRRCTTDTVLCGQAIRRGDLVCVNLASANRDETRWTHPERFDPRREPQPSLAMGTGPHTCLGRHLAALEADQMLSALIDVLLPDRSPGWALDSAGPIGRGFRSPRRLGVRVARSPG